MSDDITAALRGFADEQRLVARATSPDPALESGTLARRVRRRRTVRTGSAVLTTAALAGAVTVGVLLSGSRAPTLPAVPALTSTPMTTSTPAPPTAAPTHAAAAALRDAQPLAPGMLDSTGEGWVMLGYRALDELGATVVPDTTYLLGPDGQLFVVPADLLDGWRVTDWLPGSSLVVALGTEGSVHVLDLATGDAGPALTGSSGQFVDDGTSDVLVTTWGTSGGELSRVGADGAVRATTGPFGPPVGSAAWVQSPDRSRIVVNGTAGLQALATAGFTPSALPVPHPEGPDACRARMWADDAEVLMECGVSGAGAELWLVPVGGGDPRQLVGPPAQERLGGVWRVGDRLVAGSFGPGVSAASWWEVTDDGILPLSSGGAPELEVHGVQGSELLATLRPLSTAGSPATVSLVAIDPVSGATRTVVAADPAWYGELTVTPSRFAAAP